MVVWGNSQGAGSRKLGRAFLPMLLALLVAANAMLPWAQCVVLAQEPQTLTIDDKKLYDCLKTCFREGNLDNDGAMSANDDESQAITLNMQKVKSVEVRSVDMRVEGSRNVLETLIRDCANLKCLKLKSCNLSEFDFAILNNKESLERLYLSDCRLGAAPDITLPNLQTICLTKNDLSAAGACDRLTRERFPKMVNLWLDDCGISDVSFIENVGDLQSLYLGDNKLNDDALAALIAMGGNNLSGLKELNLGKTIHDGFSMSIPNLSSSNKFTDLAALASLPAHFSQLENLDLTYLGIRSLREFASVRDSVKIDFMRNKIDDFTGFTGDENFDLTYQGIVLSGDFVEGRESELPELLQRILDENDVLAGTLKYTGCHLSQDGRGIAIESGADRAGVEVGKGKLAGSTIQLQFKKVPKYTVPQGLTAVAGDTLAEVALPAGFTWKDDSLSVGEEGINIFQAVYTPRNTEQYIVVEDIDVPVTVKAPATEPTDPPVTGPEEPTDPEDPPATEPTDPEDPPATEPTDPEDPPATEPTDPPVTDPPVTDPPAADPKDPSKPPESTEKADPVVPPGMTEQEKREQEKRELAFNANLKVKLKGRNIHISWGRVPGADGYDVYVQYCYKRFNEKSITPVKNGRTTKVIVKKVNGRKLDLKKFCKVYVRAYKKAGNKKVMLAKTITAHVVGTKNTEYTNVKAIKLEKGSFNLKKGGSAKIKARTVLVSRGKRQLTDKHAKQFRYATTDKKVATVSAKGKIKAVGQGSCTIYVYARNGYAKKVKVKVR